MLRPLQILRRRLQHRSALINWGLRAGKKLASVISKMKKPGGLGRALAIGHCVALLLLKPSSAIFVLQKLVSHHGAIGVARRIGLAVFHDVFGGLIKAAPSPMLRDPYVKLGLSRRFGGLNGILRLPLNRVCGGPTVSSRSRPTHLPSLQYRGRWSSVFPHRLDKRARSMRLQNACNPVGS